MRIKGTGGAEDMRSDGDAARARAGSSKVTFQREVNSMGQSIQQEKKYLFMRAGPPSLAVSLPILR